MTQTAGNTKPNRNPYDERWVKISECLLSFDADPMKNINRLARLCGELLQADCVLYNRLDNGVLCAWGKWHIPDDYPSTDVPAGRICYDIIRSEQDEPTVIRHLADSKYYYSNPHVKKYGLQTYVGKPVVFAGQHVGSLCALYMRDVVPTEDCLRAIKSIATAIAVEELRRQANEELRGNEEKYRLLSEELALANQELTASQEKLLAQNAQLQVVDESLRISNEKFSRAVELAHLGPWEYNPGTGMFEFGDEFYAIYGTSVVREGRFMSAEVYAREFLHPDDIWMVEAEIVKALAAEGRFFSNQVEHRIIRRDGQERTIVVQVNVVKDATGKIMRYYGANQDITERVQAAEKLRYLSIHDSLTGLYNRFYFEEEMQRMECTREASAGVIICDVDGLKIINDTLGHNVGDLILQAVAKILCKSFRPADVVARIGGDEFAIILPDNKQPVFEAHCHNIRNQVDKYNTKHPNLPISLSLGFTVSNQAPVDMKALFKEADNNMYREKLHRQKSSRSAIVQTLMKALEVRDFLTEDHGERLLSLCESLASTLGLPENNIDDLRLLARFHDIGKVGVPDSILFKPDKLTEEEYTVMRRHCEIGYRIALSSTDLAPIADWILRHQEWWNGKGYPLGISGKEIPLECRILAIADAYDAMTNDRPYRKAMSRDAAIAELKRCAGTQFDPELVERFIEMK